MPACKIYTEITIHLILSPGTFLPNRDQLYLSIEMFNEIKRTRLIEPIFPLVIHEKFQFEQPIYSCHSSPGSRGCDDERCVSIDLLDDLPVSMELRQVTDIFLGGTTLCYFDCSARELFQPISTRPVTLRDRELIMSRTIDFPGIAPKLTLSTFCAMIGCCQRHQHSLESICSADAYYRIPDEPSYLKPTVTSSLRSASQIGWERKEKRRVKADLETHRDRLNGQHAAYTSHDRKRPFGTAPFYIDDRNPFVVRHVDQNIISRRPSLHGSVVNLKNISSGSAKAKRPNMRSRTPNPYPRHLDLSPWM